MKLTQRGVTLALMALLSVAALAILITVLVTEGPSMRALTTFVGLLMTIGLLIAYNYGIEWSRYVVVAVITLLVAVGTQEPYITEESSLTLLIPPVLAIILAQPAWVIGSLVTAYAILLARAGFTGVYAQADTVLLYALIVGGMVLSRMVTDTAQRAAERHARRAEEALATVELKAAELEEANVLMNSQLDQQQGLLDLVTTLETPAITLADGVLFAPLVGHLDSRRAQSLTNRLLQEAHQQHSRLVVIDISGVVLMDTVVAGALLQTAQALRMLGCQVTISGISASVATTLMQLQIDLTGVRTARSPQEALTRFVEAAPAANGDHQAKN